MINLPHSKNWNENFDMTSKPSHMTYVIKQLGCHEINPLLDNLQKMKKKTGGVKAILGKTTMPTIDDGIPVVVFQIYKTRTKLQ